MKQFLEVVLQWSSSQQQLVVQLVLTQNTEKLHDENRTELKHDLGGKFSAD